jgi:hypothetical protein
MTLPSDVKLVLILLPSWSVLPSLPDLDDFSEPAKSTKYSFPDLANNLSVSYWPTVIVMMKCERDDRSFYLVEQIARLSAAWVNRAMSYSRLATYS